MKILSVKPKEFYTETIDIVRVYGVDFNKCPEHVKSYLIILYKLRVLGRFMQELSGQNNKRTPAVYCYTNHSDLGDFINYAFNWSKTVEGNAFWNRIIRLGDEDT